ncbi:MAG TPA: indole-3-glycerol phosphate synthase TrpC [Actinomycetota bacterium]|nr:indole-3-glycerol phosphate synthase TrpC [Actinomycetota bacterium]
MGFLTDFVAETRRELAAHPLQRDVLAEAATEAPEARNLAWTLREYAADDGVAVIAEVKRASPSAGAIAAEVDPVLQATAYDVAGAAVISVLTEPRYFGGSMDDLRAVRAAVEHPVLRKDFLVHPDQVLEARAAGADTVLLISACLTDGELTQLLATARELGMEPLVETHTDADLDRVLATDAAVVGVNARDLETLEVDVPQALARLARIEAGRVAVLESGIRTRSDVVAAVDAGASAILVGETLMRAHDPGATLHELIHGKEIPI